MLNEYKCKETFYLEKCDEVGRLSDKQFAVVLGSKWQEDTECKYRMCGGSETIRLDRIAPKKSDWIVKLRQYVQFDFYTVDEMFVLQLFDKDVAANDGVDCIWEGNHFDFEDLFEQAIAWCMDRYPN